MDLKNLVEILVRSLVDYPDEVKIGEIDEDREIVYTVSVATSDLGKVIGKQGRIATAIRTVVKAAAVKNNMKVYVKILDND